jgi:hypothetical protein
MKKTVATQRYYKGIIAALILTIVILAGTLIAVGSSKNRSSEGGQHTETSPQQLIRSANEYLGQYVGLKEADALEKAQKDNLTARVVSRTPGEPLAVRSDFQSERLNFEIVDNRVVNVELY